MDENRVEDGNVDEETKTVTPSNFVSATGLAPRQHVNGIPITHFEEQGYTIVGGEFDGDSGNQEDDGTV